MVQEPTSPILVQQPQEPPTFRGAPTEDPDEWLEKQERVRIFNRWEDEENFRYVFFYLEDAARTWFENHESALTDWTQFKSEFLRTFRTVVRKERAALLMETRTQHPNEGVVIFVEEMKRLFCRADPDMTEEKKLRFLMRGVKQQLFACFVRNPPKSMAELVTEAAAMEKTLEIRTRQFDRPINAVVADTIDAGALSSDTLRETIRAVVREELRKLFPTTPQPQVTSMSDVIREEIQLALGASTPSEVPREHQAMTYSAAVPRPRPAPTRHQEVPPCRRPLSPARSPAAQNQAPRKADVNEGQPVPDMKLVNLRAAR
ncbi:uncharacterized protein LOC144165829 [Haemaphysalis longicornis]